MKKTIIILASVVALTIAYWLISPFFTNVKVSESLPSELMEKVKESNTSTESLLSMRGTFVGFDKIHNGTGTASIYVFIDSDGQPKSLLRFEDGFQVNNGPDLYIGFGRNGQYVKGSEISKLKGNMGAQNYEILESVDMSLYDSVWVWCKAFSTPFIKADLKSSAIGTGNTKSFTYRNATANMIQVELPFPGAVVGKDFSVIGKAWGNWFFEGSFPIEVFDKNGRSLAIGIAHPHYGDPWMTDNLVNFKADIKIPQSYIGPATLVLKKDNASGLPEHDASISFSIIVEY